MRHLSQKEAMSDTIVLSKPYSVRLPVDVASKFEDAAQQANVRVSDILRAALSGRGEVVIHEHDGESKKQRAKLMRMLGNAGNNLNQIARHLNTIAKKRDVELDDVLGGFNLLADIEAELALILELYADQS